MVKQTTTNHHLQKKPASTKVEGAGEPVKSNDGSEGNKDDASKSNSPKDTGGSDNIKVSPNAVSNPDQIT